MRSVAFRKEFANDLTDPGRAFGLFTFVAAIDVLGTGLAIDAHHTPALILPRLQGASRRLELATYERVRICWTYTVDTLETNTWPSEF